MCVGSFNTNSTYTEKVTFELNTNVTRVDIENFFIIYFIFKNAHDQLAIIN